MYCENCGASLRENAKFCDQCGALVHIGEKENCQHCHAELEPGGLFCPECGYRVMEEPAPEPVPDPAPPPDPKPDSKPDPLEQQSSTSPQPLLNVGRNAFFAAVIAAAMSVLGALWLAEISYMDMDFGEALGNGGMGFAAWLTAVFSFAHARKCREEAQRESDPQRQSFLKRQASSLVNLSYTLVLLMPILIPMIFSAIDAFY